MAVASTDNAMGVKKVASPHDRRGRSGCVAGYGDGCCQDKSNLREKQGYQAVLMIGDCILSRVEGSVRSRTMVVRSGALLGQCSGEEEGLAGGALKVRTSRAANGLGSTEWPSWRRRTRATHQEG